MKEDIMDYILADPDLSFDEVCDIIEFHMRDVPVETLREMHSDLKHAFSD